MGLKFLVGRVIGVMGTVLLGAALAACSSSTSAAPTSTPTTAPAAQGSGDTGKAGSEVAACTKANLKISIDEGQPVDGAKSFTIFPMGFTNTSGKPCSLKGAPDVSITGGDGSPAGVPARKDHVPNAPREPIVLQPGDTASAPVGRTEADSVDGCDDFPADGYAVTLPGETEWTTVKQDDLTTCTNQPVLEVGEIQPGRDNIRLPGHG